MWERGWRWTPSWRVGPGEILLPRSHPRNCLTVMRRVLPIPRASRDWVREESWYWGKEWWRSDGASGVWRIGCAGEYWRLRECTSMGWRIGRGPPLLSALRWKEFLGRTRPSSWIAPCLLYTSDAA